MPNLATQAEALREALAHIKFWHVDPLERLYLMPAAAGMEG
ncbi:hypothetical protein OG689_10780 [Kitasatospora sp. NBC_00240]|nr:hypothetical protein [Kitasatospora sp. NBC_00240]MCX5209768.1 hypothetical protein [Kitasatospora sp. NBC_00240]